MYIYVCVNMYVRVPVFTDNVRILVVDVQWTKERVKKEVQRCFIGEDEKIQYQVIVNGREHRTDLKKEIRVVTNTL